MSKVLEITGLNAQKIAPVVAGLESLLASLQVFYTNLRGYHWHIRGEQFFQLHSRFETMYDDTAEKIDEVAERILQLGVQPENRYSVLLGQSFIAESTLRHRASDIFAELVDTYTKLIAHERAVLEAADEAGDETTVSLLGDFIAEQEKTAWMLDAYRG